MFGIKSYLSKKREAVIEILPHFTWADITTKIHNYLHRDMWTSIKDMPYWNWNEIIETGDLNFIYKKESGRISDRALNAWAQLQQQHFDEFGIEDSVRNNLRVMEKLIRLNTKFVRTRDMSLMNLIKIEESKLKSSGGIEIKLYSLLDRMSNYKGFRIDMKTYPVIEWYHTLKNMAKNGNGKG